MKRSTLALAGLLAASVIALPASAAELYASLRGGLGYQGVTDMVYVDPRGAVDQGSENHDQDRMFAAAIGIAGKGGGSGWRGELELSQRSGGTFTRDVYVSGCPCALRSRPRLTSDAAMLHLYYDLAPLVPALFVEVGGGVARNRADGELVRSSSGSREHYASHSSSGFAWDVGLGLTVEVSKPINLEVGYRYVDLGDWSTGAPPSNPAIHTEGSLNDNEFYGGVRFNF